MENCRKIYFKRLVIIYIIKSKNYFKYIFLPSLLLFSIVSSIFKIFNSFFKEKEHDFKFFVDFKKLIISSSYRDSGGVIPLYPDATFPLESEIDFQPFPRLILI